MERWEGRSERVEVKRKVRNRRLDEEEVEVSDVEGGKTVQSHGDTSEQLNEDDMEVANLGILLCSETQQDIPLVLSSPRRRRSPHSIAPHHTAACAQEFSPRNINLTRLLLFQTYHRERESEQKWKKIDAENNHKRNQEQRDHMLM